MVGGGGVGDLLGNSRAGRRGGAGVRRTHASNKMSRYIATTVRKDSVRTSGKRVEIDAAVFDKTSKPYKTENYPDVLNYEGCDEHNALDRQSVKELGLMPCVATKLVLSTKEEVDPPEITYHGRRIEVNNEDGEGSLEQTSGAEAGGHRRSQSTKSSRLQLQFHQRSSSLPLEYEQGTEIMEQRARSRSPTPSVTSRESTRASRRSAKAKTSQGK